MPLVTVNTLSNHITREPWNAAVMSIRNCNNVTFILYSNAVGVVRVNSRARPVLARHCRALR
jgi:hypothetical protein